MISSEHIQEGYDVWHQDTGWCFAAKLMTRFIAGCFRVSPDSSTFSPDYIGFPLPITIPSMLHIHPSSPLQSGAGTTGLIHAAVARCPVSPRYKLEYHEMRSSAMH